MAKRCKKVKCRPTYQSCDKLFVPGEGTVTIEGRITKTHKSAVRSVSRTAKLYVKMGKWGGGR